MTSSNHTDINPLISIVPTKCKKTNDIIEVDKGDIDLRYMKSLSTIDVNFQINFVCASGSLKLKQFAGRKVPGSESLILCLSA